MATISTAVGLDRISRVSGYDIKKYFSNNDTQNLPHIIAVFGEANTANQAGLTVTKREVTSADEAATLYGYGSPIHSIMRILRPKSGEGVGGIPTIVFPQITNGAATATVRAWTVTGTATANATHTVVVNGRTSLDFQSYSYSVAIGDTPTIIAGKIRDAINGVLAAPCSATSALGVVTITSKWKGITSAELNIAIDFGLAAAGISYSQTTSTDGSGVVDLAATLSQFGDTWITDVINPYADQLDELEAFNGVPFEVNPTGRYNGLIFKPFVAYTGSVSGDKTALATITDNPSRVSQVTNVICVAPNSKGFTCEAAANVAYLASTTFQNKPNLDVNGQSYPDMPIPSNGDIGDMKDYNNRDFLVKKGCSTVMLVNGAYQIQDLVTTYHPSGELPLQYAYPRNLNIDWNVSDGYRTLETRFLKDKTLIRDEQAVDVDGCVKPKEWKSVVYDLFEDLASKGLINEPELSKSSVKMLISSTNPNRFETAFKYKRTGIARIESTTASAGF